MSEASISVKRSYSFSFFYRHYSHSYSNVTPYRSVRPRCEVHTYPGFVPLMGWLLRLYTYVIGQISPLSISTPFFFHSLGIKGRGVEFGRELSIHC